jgi:hypothetical protein
MHFVMEFALIAFAITKHIPFLKCYPMSRWPDNSICFHQNQLILIESDNKFNQNRLGMATGGSRTSFSFLKPQRVRVFCTRYDLQQLKNRIQLHIPDGFRYPVRPKST